MTGQAINHLVINFFLNVYLYNTFQFMMFFPSNLKLACSEFLNLENDSFLLCIGGTMYFIFVISNYSSSYLVHFVSRYVFPYCHS